MGHHIIVVTQREKTPNPHTRAHTRMYTHMHHLSYHTDFMVRCQYWAKHTGLCVQCFVSFIVALLFIIVILCLDSCSDLCAL